jgi:hypothetical protein
MNCMTNAAVPKRKKCVKLLGQKGNYNGYLLFLTIHHDSQQDRLFLLYAEES